nr:hypothetical protein [Candidatus Njordarchaeum guaymaensis]
MASEIIGKDSAKGRLISDYVGKDTVRLELFKALTDGRWHSTLDLWRRVKKYGQFVGLVRIGKILSQFQVVAGEDVLERREGLDISEWRITPLFISLLTEIIQTLTTASEKKNSVAGKPEEGEQEKDEESVEEDEDLV